MERCHGNYVLLVVLSSLQAPVRPYMFYECANL
jgi:hypothetical protein